MSWIYLERLLVCLFPSSIYLYIFLFLSLSHSDCLLIFSTIHFIFFLTQNMVTGSIFLQSFCPFKQQTTCFFLSFSICLHSFYSKAVLKVSPSSLDCLFNFGNFTSYILLIHAYLLCLTFLSVCVCVLYPLSLFLQEI